MQTTSQQVLTLFWDGWTTRWPTAILAVIWIVWLGSWVAGSFWSARTVTHVRTRHSHPYRLPILLGAVLLTPWIALVLPRQPSLRIGDLGVYGLTLVTVLGIAFTWWARIHLGRFWSNAITRKTDHRVIDTGPYGIVRHPIYTGLIVAILATGLAVGTAASILGAILISFGLWRKARMEEGFLARELGEDVYVPYSRRVPMLVPLFSRRP